MRPRPHRLPIAILVTLWVGCSPSATDSPPEPRDTVSLAPPSPTSVDPGLGNGFLVWESNRSGRWRLWIRDLAGGDAKQLTPEEGRNLHCCPHISPDGERIAFLSLGPDQKGYPQGGAVGALNWIRPNGSDLETLVPAARNYYENRAAVWRSPTELVYIDQDGRTALLDSDSRATSLLTAEIDDNGPWLINSALTWAGSGNGALAPYLKQRRAVASRPPQPGCQPYFSHDGAWGFWVVAPGGPIDRLRLADEKRTTWLKKSDPRLPRDFGYLYFPMLSADGLLLAFAASNDDHAHFEADYEIFVVETDPATLEIVGTPRRFTRHPATDRFPDVHLAPLPLGRHRGEAPYHWTASPEGSEEPWQWDYGDGTSSTGPAADHVFNEPGRYAIVATAGERKLDGQVTVDPPTPPELLASGLRQEGTELILTFDEAIDTSRMEARLQSGIPISSHRLEQEDHRLVLRLGESVTGVDTLHLTGVTDRAREPNPLSPVQVPIEPPLWPVSYQGLAFLWETGDAPNLLFDPTLGADTAVALTPRGPARLDAFFAMNPTGGRFEAGETAAHRVVADTRRTYEISIEMVVTPANRQSRTGVIVTSAAGQRPNFTVAQQGQQLSFALRMKSRGDQAFPRVRLLELPPNRPSHVVLTYAPGKLDAYVDGRLVRTEKTITGGFFHWRPAGLRFGSDESGRNPWHGTLEGVAIYSRVLPAAEVQESAARYSAKLQARLPVAEWRVEATLEECSDAPTLRQIEPYREALVTCQFQVDRVLDGDRLPDTARVARWSILDGAPVSMESPGTPLELRLARFADNPQLASVYLSDTLVSPTAGPLFYLLTP